MQAADEVEAAWKFGILYWSAGKIVLSQYFMAIRQELGARNSDWLMEDGFGLEKSRMTC